jgi:tetratricopeptide (TPR) repeat protein
MNYKELDNYVIYLFVLLSPFILSNSYIFSVPKNTFLVLFILLILIVKLAKMVFTGRSEISKGIFDIPVALIVISYIISTIFNNHIVMNSIIVTGETTLILVSVLTYYLVNQMKLSDKLNLIYSIFISCVIYSILILLSSAKIINWFSPDGGYFSTALYIISVLPILVSTFFKQKENSFKFLVVASLSIIVFSLGISIYKILPNSPLTPKYPSFSDSANIALSTIKKNPLVGIGPSNYLESFNKFRPFEYNNRDIWSTKFNQGSSFLLTNLTEVGIIGSVTFLALLAIFINFSITQVQARNKVGWGILSSLDLLSVFIIFLTFIIMPSFPILIFHLFLLLGIISESKKHEFVIPTKLASTLIALPLLTLISFLIYKTFFISQAEYYYVISLKNLSDNKAKEAYTNIKKAINLNSKVDRYHKAISSINFAIANTLSKNDNLSDKEKEQITYFVQDSINEAKAAVSANNKSSENWELLGRTYQLITPLAKGSEQFAIDSYKQAIDLDPINPSLRIDLGEVYMIQKDYKKAIEAFKLAVLAKPEYANSHYNLALARKENGEIEEAKKELNITLSLLDANSKDYKKAKADLDAVSITQN